MNKRDKVIDVAKGIGIILVILAHVLKGKNIFVLEVIYYFHMPLFFFISGLLSYYDKSNNFKEFLLKKFKSIIIPYIVFSIISFIYSYVPHEICDHVLFDLKLITPSFIFVFSCSTKC